MKSTIDDNKDSCYICKRRAYTELHHIFYGKNRKKSDEDKIIVWLCPNCHRGTNGVHGKKGHNFDNYLKKIGQKTWQMYYNRSTEEFIKRYGRNYL